MLPASPAGKEQEEVGVLVANFIEIFVLCNYGGGGGMGEYVVRAASFGLFVASLAFSFLHC